MSSTNSTPLRTAVTGNPLHSAVWQDEAMNKAIRDLAGVLHNRTLEFRLLTQLNSLKEVPGMPAESSKRKRYDWEQEDEQ